MSVMEEGKIRKYTWWGGKVVGGRRCKDGRNMTNYH
jgi:hypothetical protein